jgi:hypothetical protein
VYGECADIGDNFCGRFVLPGYYEDNTLAIMIIAIKIIFTISVNTV